MTVPPTTIYNTLCSEITLNDDEGNNHSVPAQGSFVYVGNLAITSVSVGDIYYDGGPIVSYGSVRLIYQEAPLKLTMAEVTPTMGWDGQKV